MIPYLSLNLHSLDNQSMKLAKIDLARFHNNTKVSPADNKKSQVQVPINIIALFLDMLLNNFLED